MVRSLLLIAGVLLLVVAPVVLGQDPTQKEKDLVKSLPDIESVPELYSGYLEIKDTSRKLHYIYLPTISENKEAPLLLWSNGGPLCSGLFGIFKEIGPLTIPDGQDKFKINVFTWLQTFSLLVIDAPAFVGFSQGSKDDEKIEWDDLQVSNELVKAFVTFTKIFPEVKGRQLFLAGEGYAGIEMPFTAVDLLVREQEAGVKLSGLILGNSFIETKHATECVTDFVTKHQLVGPETISILKNTCKKDDKSPRCLFAVAEMSRIIDPLNSFGIYDTCHYRENGYNPMRCLDVSPLAAYLNRDDVREALHVPKEKSWDLCWSAGFSRYKSNDDILSILYELRKSNIPILYYSGDTDLQCPFTCTLRVLENQKWPISNEWSIWQNGNKVGGFTQSWDKIKFATVMGAGHLAAKSEPQAVQILIEDFLESLKPVNPENPEKKE